VNVLADEYRRWTPVQEASETALETLSPFDGYRRTPGGRINLTV
jgi:hypothetical protein